MKKITSVFLLLLFFSCSARKYNYRDQTRISGNSDAFELRTIEYTSSTDKTQAIFDTRKIIYNASITVLTRTPDSTNKQLINIAQKYKGYVQQSRDDLTIIRVESAYLNEALAEIALLGKVQSKSIRSEDITDEYSDFKIRLDNAEKARKRYQELLEKAQNVGEIIIIEKELERLNAEIDLLKGKLNRFDHLVEYSTISVSVKEKVKPGLFGYVGLGVYYTFKWLFVRN